MSETRQQDIKKYNEIVEETTELKSEYIGRTALFDEMEAMYFMEPQDKHSLKSMSDNVKLTISPDARNQLLGAVRLLVAADPRFRVSGDVEDRDNIEAFAETMWGGSGQVSGIPAHYDPILSSLLYGEAHMGIINMQKLAALAQGKYHARMAEQALAMTPFLFETWSPRDCYARHGRLGLTAHYREIDTTARQIEMDWGKQASAALENKRGRDAVTYCEWWDSEYQCAWILGNKNPILCEPHELSFIPIVHCITEGSTALFDKQEKILQPFLYTLAKSGLWQRMNLSLTVLFTMIFAIGGNPMFKYRRADPNKSIDIDWTKPGGVIELLSNEDFEPMLRQVIDPSILQGLSIAENKLIESTIYKQALGQALQGNQPYSTLALLSQAGRLPLISPQRRLGWMFGQAMRIAFLWMKETSGKSKWTAQYKTRMEFDPASIPDDLDIRADLDITLPQDQLSLANIAVMLVKSGLVSEEWIRSEVLKIENNAKMSKDVLIDQFMTILKDATMQQLVVGMAQQPSPIPSEMPMPPSGGEAPTSEGTIPSGGGGAGVNIPPEMMMAGMGGPLPPITEQGIEER